MRNRISAAFLLASVLLLTGCPSNVGSGPLQLSGNVSHAYEKFKTAFGAAVFAVSPDGQYYGYSYCPAGPDNCAPAGIESIALASCDRRSPEYCKIYAYGSKVVWNFDEPAPELATLKEKTDVNICRVAGNYRAGVAPSWDSSARVVQFVMEAKRRGLTPDKCSDIVASA